MPISLGFMKDYRKEERRWWYQQIKREKRKELEVCVQIIQKQVKDEFIPRITKIIEEKYEGLVQVKKGEIN